MAEPPPDGTVARVPGLPRYGVGEEVVLFLRGESGRGFTSPVGLGQGVYRVTRVHGRPFVRGDLPGRWEDLEAFVSRVQRLVGRQL